ITFWMDKNIPPRYRASVQAGILEWNKAFEKIGFRNAIGVRWQNDSDEFDPEDINYCTFRWITTPYTFAMSGLRADPLTGEMIDGDVIFDASWIQAWKDDYALMMGTPYPAAQGSEARSLMPDGRVLALGRILSPIMAAKYGYGLPLANPRNPRSSHIVGHGDGREVLSVVPSSANPLQIALARRMAAGGHAQCQCALAKRQEYALAAMALSNSGPSASSDADAGKDDGKKSKDEVKLPENFIGQAIKEVVMHEVGHSLGLRHNFRASSIHSLAEINDPNFTAEHGMVGSVMDYNPLNIARKGQKQGDFAQTTIGPYDYWAIEYAYKPIQGDEEAELRKIAARSPQGDLTFATDEDLSLSNDPLVNTYDLGDDPLAFG
ncbi:MAG TPA: zinc-dependent metalloprotease, partial [Pirellulaceae bacterium]